MDIFEIDTICPNSGGRSQDQYSGWANIIDTQILLLSHQYP